MSTEQKRYVFYKAGGAVVPYEILPEGQKPKKGERATTARLAKFLTDNRPGEWMDQTTVEAQVHMGKIRVHESQEDGLQSLSIEADRSKHKTEGQLKDEKIESLETQIQQMMAQMKELMESQGEQKEEISETPTEEAPARTTRRKRKSKSTEEVE